MVQHIGPGVKDRRERLDVTSTVGNKDLDGHRRVGRPDRPDSRSEGARAVIGQVVARHCGNHRMGQAHLDDGVGHPTRLVKVDRIRAASIDETEPTRSSTAVAVDHEGGRSVVPAVRDVGTARLLAHRGQPLLAHQRPHAPVAGTSVQRHPHPLGLATQPIVNRCRHLSRPLPLTERAKVVRSPGHVSPVHRPGRHGSAPGEFHANGRHFARSGSIRLHPHPGIPG